MTIWPRSRARDWVRILTDPDPNELHRMLMVGQRVTWPKIKMIQNRLKIERQVDAGRDMCHRELEKRHAGVGSSSTSLLPVYNRSNTNETSMDPDEGSSLASSRASSSTETEDPNESLPGSRLQSPVPENGARDPSPASIARRRKRILAKLGLVEAVPSPLSGTTPDGSDSEHTSGDTARVGSGLRRGRFEMGSLKRRMRKGIKGDQSAAAAAAAAGDLTGSAGGSTSEEEGGGGYRAFESDEDVDRRSRLQRADAR